MNRRRFLSKLVYGFGVLLTINPLKALTPKLPSITSGCKFQQITLYAKKLPILINVPNELLRFSLVPLDSIIKENTSKCLIK